MDKENNAAGKTYVVGITGGIGSGKSLAAKFISEKGHKVISTDEIAKYKMNNDEAIKSKIKTEFGEDAYSFDGRLNTEYLAAKVFGPGDEDQAEVLKLNAIVHPAVIDEMSRLVGELEEQGEKLVFVESALIYEAGLEDGFDYIMVINSSEENCIKRAMERTKATREEIEARMKQQISPAEKAAAADFVVDNDAGPEDLRKSLGFIVNLIETMTNVS